MAIVNTNFQTFQDAYATLSEAELVAMVNYAKALAEKYAAGPTREKREKMLIEALSKKTPKVVDLEVDRNSGYIIVNDDSFPDLWDWAVNG
jgi:DNA-binding transcriptional regulator YhcF (GntR family)